MGTGHPTSGADLPDDLALRHLVSRLGPHPRTVGIDGIESQPVVQDDGLAGKKQILRHYHLAGIGSPDGSSGGGFQVDSRMRAARFPVDDSASAKTTGQRARNRPDERLGPQPLSRGRLPDFGQLPMFAGSPLRVPRVEGDKLLPDSYALCWKFLGQNPEALLDGPGPPVRHPNRSGQGMEARLDLQINPGKSLPASPVSKGVEQHLLIDKGTLDPVNGTPGVQSNLQKVSRHQRLGRNFDQNRRIGRLPRRNPSKQEHQHGRDG